MIDERFVFIAGALNIVGDFAYLIDTIKGKIKPNKVTWFLWSLAPLIAFFAQISQGVGLFSLMTFSLGIIPIFIFVASFINKNANWKITKFDLFCGTLSVLGLVLWYLTRVGNIAIFFSILTEIFAAVPTVIKAYNMPETENYKPFLLGVVASLLTLLTIKQWDFAHIAFNLYIFSICFLLFILIRFKLGKYLTKG